MKARLDRTTVAMTGRGAILGGPSGPCRHGRRTERESFIVGTVATAIAFFVSGQLVPGYVDYDGELIGLARAGAHLRRRQRPDRPIVKLLALPVPMMTLGLFGFVINAVLLLLIAWLAEPARHRLHGRRFPGRDFSRGHDRRRDHRRHRADASSLTIVVKLVR